VSPIDLVGAAVAAVVTVTVLLPSAILARLALVSLRRPLPVEHAGGERARLAVLIAAHDEEHGLGATLSAIAALGDDRSTVHVVADNCTDGTAAVASRTGVCVHIREDRSRPGKAAALNWLSAQVLREEENVDALVVIDADTHPEPGFFDGLRGLLASGADVVQGVNLVRTTNAPLTRLRDLAFHLRCELRPRAYERLGISAGLHGNGMCFRRVVLERYRWDDRSVVEDGELHLRLVAAGMRVRFASDAVVRSTMPERFGGAAGQAIRWERGKFDLFRAGIGLVRTGLATRRFALVAVGCDVLIPPLSFLVAVSTGAAIAGIAIGDAGLSVIGAASLAACGFYLARGFALARFGPRTIGRLAPWAVAYVAWKVVIVARALAGAGRGKWSQARPALTSLSPATERPEAKL
jgi:1,2-diacylglycerol 3-beta-glucosyltransferase